MFQLKVPWLGREGINTKAGRAGSAYSQSLNHGYHLLPDQGVRVLSQDISGCGEGLASVISLPAPNLPLEFIKAGVG